MPTFTIANNADFTRKIELSPEDERHLLRVMRAKPSEIFQVTNGKGKIANVKIVTTNPPAFEVIGIMDGEPLLPLTTYLPLIEQTRLEWAVEKLSELNVEKIHLMATARNPCRIPSCRKNS